MDSSPSASDALIAGLLATGVAWGAWNRNLLTLSGAVAAAAVGTATFLAGWGATVLLLLFFFSSALVARVAAAARAARGVGESELTREQSRARGALQVLAVGLLPALAGVAAAFTGDVRWMWALTGALGFAMSDTWSTDWGQTSRAKPRLLGFGSEVVPGQSGGMTLQGTAAGAVGALILAGVATLLLKGSASQWLLIAGIAWCGSILDSLLGATVQWRGRCGVCGQLTERKTHCGQRAQSVKPGLCNEGVNLVCSAVCLALAALAA